MPPLSPDVGPDPIDRDDAQSAREGLYWILFQAAPSGVFRASESGRILEANAELRALLGSDPRSDLELTLAGLCVKADDWEAMRTQLEQTGAVRAYRFEACRLDGSPFWAELSLTAVSLGGEPVLIGSLTDVSGWKAREEELLRTALRDPLTGLANRLLFNDRVEHGLRRVRREPSAVFGVLFLDIDDFKRVNDSFGHRVGDELLIAFGRRIQASVRPQDTVSRLGGDEFAILLADISTADDASVVAERIRAALAQPFVVGGNRMHLSASIGITLCNAGGAGAADLLEVADRAMYAVKSAGGNAYRVLFAEDRPPGGAGGGGVSAHEE